MALRIHKTRLFIFAVSVCCAAICVAFTFYLCKPSTVIHDRRELRAMLMVPASLRSFAVDEHARPGDTYSYRLTTSRSGLRQWALQINTKAEHRDHWRDQFAAYAAERNLTMLKRYNRGQSVVYERFVESPGIEYYLSTDQSKTSDDLTFVLMYQNLRSAGRVRRCVSRVNVYVRRLWYLFGEEPPIVDVRAS